MHTAEQDGTRRDQAESLQALTLAHFTKMWSIHHSWSKVLVLATGLGRSETALGLATLGLGGTFLVVEGDGQPLREASRNGAIDFTVSTVSEALRILKNELRKGLPVGVGVQCDPSTSLVDLVHRGVQPAAVFCEQVHRMGVAPLIERGAMLLRRTAHPASLKVRLAADLRARKQQDAELTAEFARNVAPSCAVNSAWLRVALRLFPRDTTRVYWKDEAAACRE